MKENKLTIVINKPVFEVFNFALNPINTPNWLNPIIYEEVDGFPIREGTIYKNKNSAGEWSEYIISEFKKNEMFELTKKNSHCKVKYTFKPISNTQTELNYFEYMTEGELANMFQIESLKKLKKLIETQ
jgi:hypothetical protein